MKAAGGAGGSKVLATVVRGSRGSVFSWLRPGPVCGLGMALFLIGAGGLRAKLFEKKPPVLEELNLAYGKHPKQVLDLVREEGCRDCPVVLFLHGGSWRWGGKDYHRAIGKQFAREGMIFATANYRLFPEARFPSYSEDAALALKWLRGNVKARGGDPKKVFLMGHSAGAHAVAHVGLDERYLKGVGGDFSWVKGVVSLSCPYTFDPSREWLYREIFANAEDVNATMPIHQVDGGKEPPFLVMHGQFDSLVSVRQAEDFVKKVRTEGGRVTRKVYATHGHFSTIRRMSAWHLWKKPFLRDVVTFVRENS